MCIRSWPPVPQFCLNACTSLWVSHGPCEKVCKPVRHDKLSLARWRLQLGHPKGAQTWSPTSTPAAALPPRPRTTLGPPCGRPATLTFNVAGWGIASWPPSGAPDMIPKLIHCGASGPEIRLPCRISAGFCFGKPQNRPSGAKAGRRADLDIFAMKNLAELRPGRPISGPEALLRTRG